MWLIVPKQSKIDANRLEYICNYFLIYKLWYRLVFVFEWDLSLSYYFLSFNFYVLFIILQCCFNELCIIFPYLFHHTFIYLCKNIYILHYFFTKQIWHTNLQDN